MNTPARPSGGSSRSYHTAVSQHDDRQPSSSSASSQPRSRPMIPSPPSHAQSFSARQQQQQQQHQSPDVQQSQYQQALRLRAGATSSTDVRSASTNDGSHQMQPQQRQIQPVTQFPQQVISSSVTTYDQKSLSQKSESSSGGKLSSVAVPVQTASAIQARKATLAKRLRINLVLLLAWYLVTDSRFYAYGARYVVRSVPEARLVIIWLMHRALPLLFLYNASEAFVRIRWAPVTEKPVTAVQTKSSVPSRHTNSSPINSKTTPFTPSIHKSSPLTRSSAAILPSPGTSSRPVDFSPSGSKSESTRDYHATATPPRFFRADNGSNESPTASLRRALLAEHSVGDASGTQLFTSWQQADNLSQSSSMAPLLKDYNDPRIKAYLVRHEHGPCEWISHYLGRLIAY